MKEREHKESKKLTHLPNIFCRLRVIQQELDRVLKVLALDTEEPLVIDQIGDVMPHKELR